MLKFRGLKLY